MTDKRTDSSHPSARPPLPSIAPPTDDIDSEWGADEIPAAAKVPQVAAAPPSPSPSQPPAPSPSYPPAPEPPAVRPSAPAASSAAASRPPAASNPLRKQTLLGMAPVVAPRSEPPAAATPVARSEPPRPSSGKSEPPRASQPAASPAAGNPLRKQTLLGMAPVVPVRSEPPAAAAQESAPPVAVAAEPATASSSEPAAKPAEPAEPTTSAAAIEAAPAAAADAVASDAPITRDLLSKSSRPPAPRVAPSVLDTDDLPELRARRPRWLLPVAAAAVIGLGVVGLRKLDRPPTPLAAVEPTPVPKAATPPAAPQADDSDDTDSAPNPTTPSEPEPLQAASAAAATAAVPAAVAPAPQRSPAPAAAAASPDAVTDAAAPAPASDTAAPEVASGETKSVNVTSDPPGARMFWRGKEVGTTPFVLEVPAGERRSYELGRPGFVTRKVVIDGSKSDITIGLKPEG